MKWLAAVAAAGGVEALRFGSLEEDLKKNRPVSKVIAILKDMNKTLEKEAEEDEKVYSKMECWCRDGNSEKTEAIKEAETAIARLTAEIEEGAGKSAQLSTEIKHLEEEIADNTASLEAATKIREKQAAEFNEKNKELLQTISALKSALTVLAKHQKTSLLQVELPEIRNIRAMLQHTMKKYKGALSLTDHDQKTVDNFLQGKQAPSVNPYANQSGEIFGILQNMLDTFIADNKEALDAEAAAAQQFTEFKEAKESMIAAMQGDLDSKQNQLAQTDEKMANDKQELEDTKDSLSEDEKYLMMLKEKCAQTDAEWAERQKTRSDEMAAVSKALEFLSSDEAHDLFTKTFNPSFVQVQSVASGRREKAAEFLQKVAKKYPKLAVLALKARNERFEKVFKAIDKMVSDIREQKEDDKEARDFCVSSFHETEKDTMSATNAHEDAVAQIDRLEATIQKLDSNIKLETEAVKEAQTMLKREGEIRAKANADFQETIADQRATMKLLEKTVAVLKGFYAKDAALVQQPAGPPPPAGFKAYSNNSGGSSVIAMITQIINDAKMMEAEAIHDEKDAQATYEATVQDTNDMITQKEKMIVNFKNNRATAKGDKLSQEETKKNLETTLTALDEKTKALHVSCDFLLKNFEIRQQAMTDEVDALMQAKAILKGSDFTKL